MRPQPTTKPSNIRIIWTQAFSFWFHFPFYVLAACCLSTSFSLRNFRYFLRHRDLLYSVYTMYILKSNEMCFDGYGKSYLKPIPSSSRVLNSQKCKHDYCADRTKVFQIVSQKTPKQIQIIVIKTDNQAMSRCMFQINRKIRKQFTNYILTAHN